MRLRCRIDGHGVRQGRQSGRSIRSNTAPEMKPDHVKSITSEQVQTESTKPSYGQGYDHHNTRLNPPNTHTVALWALATAGLLGSVQTTPAPDSKRFQTDISNANRHGLTFANRRAWSPTRPTNGVL